MIAAPAAAARRELDKNRIRSENASGTAGISQILVTIQLMKLPKKANTERRTPNAERRIQKLLPIRRSAFGVRRSVFAFFGSFMSWIVTNICLIPAVPLAFSLLILFLSSSRRAAAAGAAIIGQIIAL